MPIGTKYTVTETDATAEGYFPTVKTYSGQIEDTADINLPFVNVYTPSSDGKFGTLTVSKQVIGEKADLEKEFEFTIVFSGENAPEKQTFLLKAGESKKLENIPHGTAYTVTETDSAGYYPVLDTASGVIAGDHIARVTFINKKTDTPDKPVKLTVQKLLSGELIKSDKNRAFNLTLTVNGKSTNFTLKADEIKEFEVPFGAVYSVSEQDYMQQGFSQSIVNGFGTATEDLTEIVLTNSYVGNPRIEIIGKKPGIQTVTTGLFCLSRLRLGLKTANSLLKNKLYSPI